MKIALVNILNGKIFEKLKQAKIDTVIYAGLDPQMDFKELSAMFRMVNIYDDFIHASEFSFNLVRDQLNLVKKGNPTLFSYRGYDLIHGLEKDIYFGTLKTNAMHYQLSRFKHEPHRVYDYSSRSGIHKWLALVKRLFVGKVSVYELEADSVGKKISPDMVAFRINEMEMLELYGDLIPGLPREKMFSFQNIIRVNANEIHQRLDGIFKFNIKSRLKSEAKSKIGWLKRMKILFQAVDSDFLNVMSESLFKLINHVEQYEILMQLGVKKLMVAAAENEGEGNIICQVAAKHNCITYNYMNGAKAKDSHNIHTYFNYWFMPDTTTRDLILSFCDVKPEQLPVAGHLLEEKARKHNYTGTLDKVTDKLKGKKVISVLTSPAFITEQMDVMNFFHNYLNENEDCIVLVRKHPFDKRENIITHPNMILLPTLAGNQFNDALFDLFICSSATVSFSSTVSLQSSWFNLLTVNFEYAEKSMLPYVDDKRIFLANSVFRLKELLDNYFANSTSGTEPPAYLKASENIISVLSVA